MTFDDMKSSDIERNLKFLENRYTSDGLMLMKQYQGLLQEAIRRGIRAENLTPEQQMARLELEGPGFSR